MKKMKFSVRYTDSSKKLFIENFEADSEESILKNFLQQKEKYLLEIICLEKNKYVFDAKASDLSDLRISLEKKANEIKLKIKERQESGSLLFDEDVVYLMNMSSKIMGALHQSF